MKIVNRIDVASAIKVVRLTKGYGLRESLNIVENAESLPMNPLLLLDLLNVGATVQLEKGEALTAGHLEYIQKEAAEQISLWSIRIAKATELLALPLDKNGKINLQPVVAQAEH